ncbi:DUF3772 domain-containing protein [Sphingosinicella sp. BN140058]|uniref:DUF3772 domain-containing protein n=1 Tax=Sphingosinicella sp. BN140058 TaxID=1892855 RepID=UPI001013B0E4|nr:DUF3772 domain-containing protein [Sphingosinicella sp. BN140058]QAY78332.1 mechanosensitive ion channel family protein [Sphingosinicella sp. BN140058]
MISGLLGRSPAPAARKRLSLLGAIALLLFGAGIALAQQRPIAELNADLQKIENDIHAIDRALDGRIDEKQRQLVRGQAVGARDAAGEATAGLQEQLALVEAKITELGPVPPGTAEAADIRAQRASLGQQRATLDSAVKRGKLLGLEAQQLIDEVDQSQAEQFNRNISARAASPLSPGFWKALVAAFPRDFRRVAGFVAANPEPRSTALPWQALLATVAALLILLPGRMSAHRLSRRLLVEGAPGHRVRRSVAALARVLIGTLAPLLATLCFIQGLRWANLTPARWNELLDALTIAATFAGFTASTLGAVLMRNQASWRLAPISDAVAGRLRPFSWLLAGLAFFSILLEAFNEAVGASHAANAALQAAETLLHLLVIGGALLAIGRLRAARADDEENAPGRAGLGAITLLLWLLLALALIGLFAGFIGFGLFIVQIIAWTIVLGSAVYLLMTAIDDIATTLFVRGSPVGLALTRGLGIRPSAIDQFGVLLSGTLRLALALVALGLLLTPFGAGTGVETLFGRLGLLAQGFELGGVAISPGAILRGLIVLFIGLGLVRAFMHWLDARYLPATDLDGSGRNSVSLVARYVGIALAAIWALASLGIGVERIALLLSALSVGIGFGLQAITSNFVSGLILLAERPIKIGDWIRVGTDEGDVKRISVRSTEIALADHSTLIVPNSELITKSVINKTLASPLGRIQIQFSVPIDSDADRVRQLVAEAFEAEPTVLADPAPAIFIDAVADGRIAFNCFAHVGSPRDAYPARSAILFALLARFRAEGIEVGTIPQRVEFVDSRHPERGTLRDEDKDPPPVGASG